MRYLSLFSGMEAAHLAWAPLGWQCVGVAEIDPAACTLLRHRLPDVPNLGSVTDITEDQVAALGRIDLVIGGSPCQDLSVAGRRAGLGGARSGLFHQQLRIFDAARHLCGARWLVWENVPGAFSSNKGRDFAVVVGAMAGSVMPVPREGWGSEGVALGDNGLVEWSVLDAQWFGLAQRRRRVFAVLDTGDWADRPPILLEQESLRGTHSPQRSQRKVLTDGLSARSLSISDPNSNGCYDALTSTPLAFGGGRRSGSLDVAACLTAKGARIDFEVETFVLHPTDLAPGVDSDDASKVELARDGMGQVRRLTPLECERLQGAPDDWTLVPNNRGKPMADGPRYKLIGNSIAVPVLRWIGTRIDSVSPSAWSDPS